MEHSQMCIRNFPTNATSKKNYDESVLSAGRPQHCTRKMDSTTVAPFKIVKRQSHDPMIQGAIKS
eukprot:5204077-Pyramimonas_sp.AAC.2